MAHRPIPEPTTLPPASEADSGEIMRVWIVNKGGLHLSLNPEFFDDDSMYGLMLADLCHHIINARSQVTKRPVGEVGKAILSTFENAFNDTTATDSQTGTLHRVN
jgi:hypothetical protein